MKQPRIEILPVTLALACGVILASSGLAQNTNSAATNDELKAERQTNTDQTISDESEKSSSDSIEQVHWRRRRHSEGINRNAIVVIGRNVELKEGEYADTVVVIGGSAKIRGKVEHAAVVIGGNLDVDGEIGEAAVAVLGNIRAGQGAIIHGEVVSVGGRTDIAKGAKIEGQTQEVDFGGSLPPVQWLKNWVVECLLKLRILAPHVGWVWAMWGVLLLIYLLIAAVFPRPVQACVDELVHRPATTFLMGILTKLLLPVVIFVLLVTVIGIIVVPFFLAALFLGFLVGKVAIMECLGFQLRKQFGSSNIEKPLPAFLLGAVIITILYLIPVIGLLTFAVISVWGLGAAVMAAFGGFRRELPSKPSVPPTAPAPVPAPAPPTMPPPTTASFTPSAQTLSAQTVTAPITEAPAAQVSSPPTSESPPSNAPVPPAATLPEAWAFPRASFWERMAAAFLDVVLVGILVGIVRGMPQGLLVALAYFTGMWAWKATSIGGVVLGLKVARLDGQPITFTIALVRALAAAFSVIVFFLGFLWIIWDKEKQGWHDRIAGTVVVKLPKSTSLVCF